MKKLRGFKRGFTLAETMITLTIIGVLAAIIIPVVSQNINDKAFTDSKSIFSKKLTEAMSQMRTADKMSGYSTNQEFLDEFQNYMRANRTCDLANLTDCFASTIYAADGEEVDVVARLKTGKDFGKDSNTNDLVGAVFANGTTAVIAYDPACVQQSPFETADPTSCLSILYDINGRQKPNKAGRDIMMYHVDKLGTACAGFDLGGTCYGTPFTPTPLTNAECNSDAVPLGAPSCCPDVNCGGVDYWAGAIKDCGGIANLPSRAELQTITEALYPVGSWTFQANEDRRDGDLDDAKASSYGFNPASTIYLLTGETAMQFSNRNAAVQAYTANFSSLGMDGSGRHIPRQAICKIALP